MNDRALGAQQDTHQNEEDGIELLAPIHATLHDCATPTGLHGEIHGPPPGGGILHRAVDSVRQLLGLLRAPGATSSFSPLSSEDTDAHPCQGAASFRLCGNDVLS